MTLRSPQSLSRVCNSHCFERTPEKLVLEGYRHWTAGFQTGSITPWEMAWNLYATSLGPADGRRLLAEMSNYVRTLKTCAQCPLRAFPFGARHLCVEECLTMGLIAGLQNGDGESAAELCLSKIACAARCDVVSQAADAFAATLTDLGHRMLPIPPHVVEDVLARAETQRVASRPSPSSKLH